LLRAQPSMAPIVNLVGAVQAAVQSAAEPASQTTAAASADAEEVIEASIAAAQVYVVRAVHAAAKAAEHAAVLIGHDTAVLTHSRSSTVLAAFEAARKRARRFSVIATESRPMLEGRTLAERLASLSIPVTLIADAAAACVMERVDLVMIGADWVTPDYLVNKVGSHLIALAAQALHVPVYAVSDTSKFTASNGISGCYEGRDASELWPDAPAGVTVFNPYFEAVPRTLITGLVTEEGLVRFIHPG
jgi:translation initiation factor 2B subunit (eIF-2B alpha/beta/delta family)